MVIDLGEYGMIEATHDVVLTPAPGDPKNVNYVYSTIVFGKPVSARHWNQDAALRNFKREVIHRITDKQSGYWKPEGNFTGD